MESAERRERVRLEGREAKVERFDLLGSVDDDSDLLRLETRRIGDIPSRVRSNPRGWLKSIESRFGQGHARHSERMPTALGQ